MGDIAGRAKIETAEANTIDSAMPWIYLPELARRDTSLEQRFNPGVAVE
jgi:hypothetical protein